MKKNIAIAGVAICVFVAAFVFRQLDRGESDAVVNPAATAGASAVLPRLVDLGSDQCIPCKRMAPILRELSEQNREVLVVEVIDVRKEPSAAQLWGIRVIPTQIFIDAAGKERFRHEGFMAKTAILEKWRELGVELIREDSGSGV